MPEQKGSVKYVMKGGEVFLLYEHFNDHLIKSLTIMSFYGVFNLGLFYFGQIIFSISLFFLTLKL